MSLIHNERTKLTAAWLNTLSSAATTAGVIAPLAAVFYGVSNSSIAANALFLGSPVWLFTGVGLHLAARYVLGGLKP